MAQGHIDEPMTRPATDEDKPIREVVVDLWGNIEKLLRQEFALAAAELDVRIDQAKKEIGGAVAGTAVLYAGVLALVATVILLLSEVMVAWLAALIVAVACVGGGFALLQKAKKDLESTRVIPERSVQSVQRDVHVFKEATK